MDANLLREKIWMKVVKIEIHFTGGQEKKKKAGYMLDMLMIRHTRASHGEMIKV